MKKILFFALALVAGVLAFTSCNPNEPELVGTVYHYKGVSDVRNGSAYEHEVYIALDDKSHKMTMKWVGVKASDDAEPVTLYLYNGSYEKEENGYHIHCDGTPQLPDGKPFDKWESFDVDGWCDAEYCDFDYHINGTTGAIFSGQIVK